MTPSSALARAALLQTLARRPAPLAALANAVGGTAFALGTGSRAVSASRTVQQLPPPSRSSEATETLLAQQMLDFMGLESDATAQESSVAAQLPITGVVMDVKNNIASISGLRRATIGSVVAISAAPRDGDTDERDSDADAVQPLCRGIVLFLEKKVVQVALLSERGRPGAVRAVQSGMRVALESEQLEIAASVAKLAGRAVDPLGEPLDLVYSDSDSEDAAPEPAGSTERVPIAWGTKTVPGLLQRRPLSEPFATGILALDCFQPLAFGHRFALLGPRNSGKTRLVLDIIVQQVNASRAAGRAPPHFVYVSVGKSALRVQQTLDFLARAGALPHTTLVAADDRASLISQYLAPFAGCALAEFFMRRAPSRQSVVVYDDLASHTVVVESLVQTMKLPRISQLSLSAHEVLMERSAALADGHSLTTFALADAPDSSAGESTAFAQKMRAIVDDAVTLEGPLALQRVYPPVDVLRPGGSIRGPPFQAAALWKHAAALRALVNRASLTKANADVSKTLGLEVEPEDLEELAVRDLVRQFFVQPPLAPTSAAADVARAVGVCFLAGAHVRRLPPGVAIWDFVHAVMRALGEQAPELLHLLETHPRDQVWPPYVEDELAAVFAAEIATLRKTRQAARDPRRRGR
ncbi:hypothetical protein PybrP1_006426 [[Pythium] brassicae (nom. inval.)]|nr:hypothetical protein PybrP1_006426 [[Pythium] brassicae (nom. inval.)]